MGNNLMVTVTIPLLSCYIFCNQSITCKLPVICQPSGNCYFLVLWFDCHELKRQNKIKWRLGTLWLFSILCCSCLSHERIKLKHDPDDDNGNYKCDFLASSRVKYNNAGYFSDKYGLNTSKKFTGS